MSYNVFLSIFWIASMVGTTIIFVYGSIFGWLRKAIADRNDFIYEMASCGQCMGFWIGMGGSLILYFSNMPGAYFAQLNPLQLTIAIVSVGAVVSLLSTFASKVIEL